jgi:hypothetical protein
MRPFLKRLPNQSPLRSNAIVSCSTVRPLAEPFQNERHLLRPAWGQYGRTITLLRPCFTQSHKSRPILPPIQRAGSPHGKYLIARATGRLWQVSPNINLGRLYGYAPHAETKWGLSLMAVSFDRWKIAIFQRPTGYMITFASISLSVRLPGQTAFKALHTSLTQSPMRQARPRPPFG